MHLQLYPTPLPHTLPPHLTPHTLPPIIDDHSRVKLREDYTEDGRDYINASFIVDTDPQHPKYIATQAPLEKTIADFWQVPGLLPHLKILHILIDTIVMMALNWIGWPLNIVAPRRSQDVGREIALND